MQTTSFIGSGVCENEPLCIPGLAGWMPMETDMAITRRLFLRKTVAAGAVAATVAAPVVAAEPEMTPRRQARGAVTGATLSQMLDACEEALNAINAYDEDAPFDDPALNALCERRCELALGICGYRPLSDTEARRKVEFLRDWTESTPLSEKEQNALFASMMPEGGDA